MKILLDVDIIASLDRENRNIKEKLCSYCASQRRHVVFLHVVVPRENGLDFLGSRFPRSEKRKTGIPSSVWSLWWTVLSNVSSILKLVIPYSECTVLFYQLKSGLDRRPNQKDNFCFMIRPDLSICTIHFVSFFFSFTSSFFSFSFFPFFFPGRAVGEYLIRTAFFSFSFSFKGSLHMIPVTGLAQLVGRISSVHVENFSPADRDETLYADHEHENINS